MADIVPPVPHKSLVLTENGYLTAAWAGWLRQLYIRIGGVEALSNIEIGDQLQDLTTLQAAVTTLQTAVTTLQSNINDLNQGPRL